MSYKLSHLEKSLVKLETIREKVKKKSIKIGFVRLAVFICGVILSGISFFLINNICTQIILTISLLVFIVVSIWQVNFLKYLKKLENWIGIKKSFISRTKLDWDNIERKNIISEIEFTNLEIDFNLVGKRSLLHLIDFSSSKDGTDLLRDMLTNHKLEKTKISDRQNIIRELFSFNHFRDRFLLLLASLKGTNDKNGMINMWLDSPAEIKPIRVILFLLIPLALINIVLIVLHVLEILPSVWMISSFIYVAIYYLSNKYYNSISKISDVINEELGRISKVFEFIDETNFSKYPKLRSLCEPIKNKESSPILLLNQALRLANILPLRSNPFVWFFIALLFPIDFYIAYKFEKYKVKLNENYEGWKNIIHQLEAYISIAIFAKLNVEYNFPHIFDDRFEFNAEKIGHPLIKKSEKVENNFRFQKVGDVFVITGSNMSGKSTFLRTLGINICLGYAGAPVNASLFNLSLMRIFSCIKVSDSVIDGISYFYSEVKRLKELLVEFDKNENIPIVFFIDEIFKGTNNIERRIGSTAYIRSIVGRNGVGFITTHDLDLIKLAEDNPRISNYHFKENIRDNKMEFDYTIHEGPCPTTNALQIMKIEGLPI